MCTEKSLSSGATESEEERINARIITNLLCASFCSQFVVFQLIFSLRSTHYSILYQYHVFSTEVDRVIEFLNMSSILRYLAIRLHRVVIVMSDRIVLVSKTLVNC